MDFKNIRFSTDRQIYANFHSRFPGVTLPENMLEEEVIQASRIIELTFVNILVPTFTYLYSSISAGKYTFEFINDNKAVYANLLFMEDKFALKGCILRPDLEGKKFSELAKYEQRRINSTLADIHLISGKNEDREEIIAHFKSIAHNG